MTKPDHILARALSTMAVGMGLLAGVPAQAANNPNPTVIPPHAKFGGLTLGEWNVRLWQWLDAHLAMTPDSPTFDPTGANLGVDQAGPVWFLTLPGFGPETVREVTIPSGVALLVTVGSGSIGGMPWDPPTDQLASAGEFGLTHILANWQLTVDGRAIENLTAYGVVSPLFNYTLPENNVAGVPAGEYGPAVATGYTPLLAPMSVGQHIIDYSWDVLLGRFAGHWHEVYLVTVVPGY